MSKNLMGPIICVNITKKHGYSRIIMVASPKNNIITVSRTHFKQIKSILWCWTASRRAGNDNFFKQREINYLEKFDATGFPSFKLTGFLQIRTHRKSRNDHNKNPPGRCNVKVILLQLIFLRISFSCFYSSIIPLSILFINQKKFFVFPELN